MNKVMNNFLDQVAIHPEQFCVEVVYGFCTYHYDDLAFAKTQFPSIDPHKNGKEFTSAMYNGFCDYHQRHQMRFEDWEAYERMSR